MPPSVHLSAGPSRQPEVRALPSPSWTTLTLSCLAVPGERPRHPRPPRGVCLFTRITGGLPGGEAWPRPLSGRPARCSVGEGAGQMCPPLPGPSARWGGWGPAGELRRRGRPAGSCSSPRRTPSVSCSRCPRRQTLCRRTGSALGPQSCPVSPADLAGHRAPARPPSGSIAEPISGLRDTNGRRIKPPRPRLSWAATGAGPGRAGRGAWPLMEPY